MNFFDSEGDVEIVIMLDVVVCDVELVDVVMVVVLLCLDYVIGYVRFYAATSTAREGLVV